MAYLGVEVSACPYELSYPGSVVLLSSHQEQQVYWGQALCKQQHARSQELASVAASRQSRVATTQSLVV